MSTQSPPPPLSVSSSSPPPPLSVSSSSSPPPPLSVSSSSPLPPPLSVSSSSSSPVAFASFLPASDFLPPSALLHGEVPHAGSIAASFPDVAQATRTTLATPSRSKHRRTDDAD